MCINVNKVNIFVLFIGKELYRNSFYKCDDRKNFVSFEIWRGLL